MNPPIHHTDSTIINILPFSYHQYFHLLSLFQLVIFLLSYFPLSGLLRGNVWILAILFWWKKPIPLSQSTFIFLQSSFAFPLSQTPPTPHPKRQWLFWPHYLRLVLLVLKAYIHGFVLDSFLVPGFFHSAKCFWDSSIRVYQWFVFLSLTDYYSIV